MKSQFYLLQFSPAITCLPWTLGDVTKFAAYVARSGANNDVDCCGPELLLVAAETGSKPIIHWIVQALM